VHGAFARNAPGKRSILSCGDTLADVLDLLDDTGSGLAAQGPIEEALLRLIRPT
jgi:hypothetical protein